MDWSGVLGCVAFVFVAAGCGGGRATPVIARASPPAPAACADASVRWRGRMVADGAVDVRISRGSVRAEGVGADEVVIESTARNGCACGWGERGARVRVSPDERGVRFAARCDEVDVVVRLPESVRLSVHAVNGSVHAERVRDVDVHVVNGTIELAHVHRAQVHAVNGGIRASFDAPEQALLSTVNGNVEAFLPAGGDVDVQARSVSGLITLALPQTETRGLHGASGTLGRGGHLVRVKTVSGQIRVQTGG
jgi:Toastrack DUF4097